MGNLYVLVHWIEDCPQGCGAIPVAFRIDKLSPAGALLARWQRVERVGPEYVDRATMVISERGIAYAALPEEITAFSPAGRILTSWPRNDVRIHDLSGIAVAMTRVLIHGPGDSLPLEGTAPLP